MKEQILRLIVSVVAAVLMASETFADAPATTGVISKVTVYRGQALVSRTISIDLPADASELIVNNLPVNIVPESIYAQAAGDVKVLSVRYRQRAVMEDTREEVKQLDNQIADVKHQLKFAESENEHYTKQWQMFEKLKEFTITAANSDLNRGLLTFEPVENLTSYVEKKGLEYLNHRLELEDKVADLKKQQELLDRKRQELTAGQSRTEREAVVFLSRGSGRKITIELNYLVNNANWQQQYNLRADAQDSKVLVEYNAVVNQTSGEDWNSVVLSLSTAEPTMVSAAPVLEPMVVSLGHPAQQADQQTILSQDEQVGQYLKVRKDYGKKGIAANQELNEMARHNQAFFLNVDRRIVEEFQQRVAKIARIEGVSVTYDLPGRLTLPSRSDQQLVTITAITARADFTLIATPLLTDYVYLQADVLNDSTTIFLPGPASMFRNGEFIGRSNIPQVTIGEKFTAGFGIDSQVRLTHELEDKQTRIQGGNRIDTYQYRIALSNYKKTPVELRLLDRLPYSDDASVKIELSKAEPELSKDAEYLRTARKKGILRWDLKLPANTIDDKAIVVKYGFTMEYDRNMQIQLQRLAQ